MTLFAELKRRNVVRVGAAFVAISMLAMVVLMIPGEQSWFTVPAGADSNSRSAIDAEPPPPEAPKTLPAEPADRSIAILPFANRGVSRENARFFSDGFHDDLLTRLSGIRSLEVISRDSVMTFRDTAMNTRQIGRELGAGRLLEGGVQQAGDRVRIDVKLIDATSGEQIWAQSWDREANMENLFAIQREIAQGVAHFLKATLTAAEELELGTAPTQNLEAYRAVLISGQVAYAGRSDSIGRAADFARKAIRLDPAYAEAHLALAFSLAQGIENGAWPEQSAGDEIRNAITTAMSLRPGYAEAWSALGRYQDFTGDPGAADSFEKAIQLNPGNAQTLHAFGNMLLESGKPQEALPLLTRSSRLNPLSVSVLLATGRVYDRLEAWEEARSMFARIREIDPSSPLAYTLNSASYFPQGRLDEALYWVRQGLAVDPGDFELGGWMVFLNDCLEDFEAAGEWSRWLGNRVTNQAQPMAMQARHHYLIGNFELALQYANLAIRLGLENRWNSDSIFMRIKRDEALANGTPEAGIEVFRNRHPQLFEDEPLITADNILQAVDLALLLKLTGRTTETRTLLTAVIDAYGQPWFTTGSARAWLVPAKAQALAILGDQEGALTELRRIIDNGWRVYWRWGTNLNPNFNGIARTAEFQSMVARIEADMAAQRARTQAMAVEGNIPPPETDRD